MDQDEILFNDILSNLNVSEASVMEFGVASGNTGCSILNVLLHRKVAIKRYIGFDSFLGLPEEEDGVPIHSDWSVGAFNILYENHHNQKIQDKANTKEEAIKSVIKRFGEYMKYNVQIDIVQGIYQDTLNSQTIKNYDIQPVDFIHIDCDLYVSAIQALDFIFSNSLLKENGIIRYDDMRECPDDGGEKRAHREAVDKYKLILNPLSHDAYVYLGKQV